MGIGGFCVALIAAAIALDRAPGRADAARRARELAHARRSWPGARSATRAPAHEGFWYRLSRLVMRFPGRIAATTAALLIALGLPFFGIEFTSVDAQVLPESASARQVDDVLRAEFPPYRDTPVDARRPRRAPPTRSAPRARRPRCPAPPRSSPPQSSRGGNCAIDVDLHGRRRSTRAARISSRDLRALPTATRS